LINTIQEIISILQGSIDAGSSKPTDTLIWETLDPYSLGVKEAMWAAFCKSEPVYDDGGRAAQAIMDEVEDWREKANARALVRRTANELGGSPLFYADEFFYDTETAADRKPKVGRRSHRAVRVVPNSEHDMTAEIV
jgi:hypothetical protein